MTLNQFEGQDVYDAQVRIVKTGDGLSAAMEVEPIEIRNRQIGISVLEWQCTSNAFDNAKDGDGLVRVAKLSTTRAATIMPDEPLYKMIMARLNNVTEQLARAGAAPGSTPGQGTLPQDEAKAQADADWEDSARSRKGRPTDDSDVEVPDDISSLDDELAEQ
jgi:hypothetical protein